MSWVHKNVFICLVLSEECSSMKGRSQDLPLKSHAAVRTNSSNICILYSLPSILSPILGT